MISGQVRRYAPQTRQMQTRRPVFLKGLGRFGEVSTRDMSLELMAIGCCCSLYDYRIVERCFLSESKHAALFPCQSCTSRAFGVRTPCSQCRPSGLIKQRQSVTASLSLARVASLVAQESWMYSALGSHAASGGIGAEAPMKAQRLSPRRAGGIRARRWKCSAFAPALDNTVVRCPSCRPLGDEDY